MRLNNSTPPRTFSSPAPAPAADLDLATVRRIIRRVLPQTPEAADNAAAHALVRAGYRQALRDADTASAREAAPARCPRCLPVGVVATCAGCGARGDGLHRAGGVPGDGPRWVCHDQTACAVHRRMARNQGRGWTA